MRNILILAAAAIMFVVSMPISMTATARTRAQCNAGYSGCLAVCGNKAVGAMTPVEKYHPKPIPKACSDNCKSELSSCLTNASDSKRGK